MFAVIETGGKQYLVKAGEKLEIEKLVAEAGAQVAFDKVLMVGRTESDVQIGKPYVEGARVTAKVLEQKQGDKVLVYKFKKRKNYRRKRGHRQLLTVVEIVGIE